MEDFEFSFKKSASIKQPVSIGLVKNSYILYEGYPINSGIFLLYNESCIVICKYYHH